METLSLKTRRKIQEMCPIHKICHNPALLSPLWSPFLTHPTDFFWVPYMCFLLHKSRIQISKYCLLYLPLISWICPTLFIHPKLPSFTSPLPLNSINVSVQSVLLPAVLTLCKSVLYTGAWVVFWNINLIMSFLCKTPFSGFSQLEE